MARFPSGCSGESTWKVDETSGHWFPVGTEGATPGCVVATFTLKGRAIDNDVGLDATEVAALRRSHGEVIKQDPHDPQNFILPLVPEGTPPIEIGP